MLFRSAATRRFLSSRVRDALWRGAISIGYGLGMVGAKRYEWRRRAAISEFASRLAALRSASLSLGEPVGRDVTTQERKTIAEGRVTYQERRISYPYCAHRRTRSRRAGRQGALRHQPWHRRSIPCPDVHSTRPLEIWSVFASPMTNLLSWKTRLAGSCPLR